MLVRLSPYFWKTAKQPAKSPGSLCLTVNETKVLYRACSSSVSASPSAAPALPSGRAVPSSRRRRSTRNRVLFPSLSSRFSARNSSPFSSPAIRLEIAALHPESSCCTISAAFEVEETSMRSTPLKYVVRKSLHWPQAWWWEYNFVICPRSRKGFPRDFAGEGEPDTFSAVVRPVPASCPSGASLLRPSRQ